MSVIQILIALFALYAATRALLRFRRGSIGLAELALWLCFWAAVAVCVLRPGITQWVASILGVGRGADAVTYLSLVALSYVFFRVYLRIRHSEQQLTRLVRALALEHARLDDKD
jgi:small membrane protein